MDDGTGGDFGMDVVRMTRGGDFGMDVVRMTGRAGTLEWM